LKVLNPAPVIFHKNNAILLKPMTRVRLIDPLLSGRRLSQPAPFGGPGNIGCLDH
jgi:hypothetical protein